MAKDLQPVPCCCFVFYFIFFAFNFATSDFSLIDNKNRPINKINICTNCYLPINYMQSRNRIYVSSDRRRTKRQPANATNNRLLRIHRIESVDHVAQSVPTASISGRHSVSNRKFSCTQYNKTKNIETMTGGIESKSKKIKK